MLRRPTTTLFEPNLNLNLSRRHPTTALAAIATLASLRHKTTPNKAAVVGPRPSPWPPSSDQVQVCECPNVKMPKYQNVRLSKCQHAKMPNCQNAKMPNVKKHQNNSKI